MTEQVAEMTAQLEVCREPPALSSTTMAAAAATATDHLLNAAPVGEGHREGEQKGQEGRKGECCEASTSAAGILDFVKL